MKTTPKDLFWLTLLILCVILVQANAASALQMDLPGLRKYVQDRMTKESIPAIAIAVMRDKQIVWEEGFGWADRENHLRATPHIPFYVASVTKAITGTAVMLLAERHQINLDHSINEYLGSAKLHSPKWDASQATVRRVANHTAGLTTYHQTCNIDDANCQISTEAAIRRYGILFWPPGDHFDYSNLGYGILGDMVSHVSGKSYGDFLHDEIFSPLGMKNCFLEVGRVSGPNAARYDSSSHTRSPIQQSDTPGASTVHCSVQDLALFGMFTLMAHDPGQKQILSDASLQMMLNPNVETGDGERYGFGWSLQPKLHGYKGIYAQGGTNDSFAVLQMIPSEKIAVAVIANTGTTFPFEIVDKILGDMLPRYREDLTHQSSTSSVKPPFPPISSMMTGNWKGEIDTWKGKVPLTLTISPDRQVYVQLGNGPRVVATNIDVQKKRFYCVIRGDVQTPDAPQPPYDIEIELYLRAKLLLGAATTKDGVQLPYWAQLQRITDFGK
jgi:CubicO group peptidase (beta-lactamase class C family)